MTQEQKDLLLKDLCARLPYGVEVEYDNSACKLLSIDKDNEELTIWKSYDYIPDVKLEEVKPYLFPLSSITEEQKNNCPISETNLNIIKSNIGYGIIEIPWRLLYIFIEWCNKNHFDYRGIIPMGLANDATNLNIY